MVTNKREKFGQQLSQWDLWGREELLNQQLIKESRQNPAHFMQIQVFLTLTNIITSLSFTKIFELKIPIWGSEGAS